MVEWKFTAGINPNTISTITWFVKPTTDILKYLTDILPKCHMPKYFYIL